ncbi:hypothetical protein VPLG_00122 [Vibrio phage eugene 12A10]|uniref:hypothetical protein n=1 Tax=Vibrio phage eugene 12A10 TaxID=573172 RepID=UPI0003516095|nr:hypothetical protein VPLG_00122 [Vibrio phage eugene 12A10]AGN51561.1 hypothetical protein VPLG_00122 [Vibrio phage eugene 12A10]
MNIEILKGTTIFPALQVLDEFIKLQGDMECVDVESFTNCREQGFNISNFESGFSVSFSQNRNSDDIVVYFGSDRAFCHLHNTPENWDSKHYFDYDDHYCAAKFIHNFLNNNTEGK